MKRGYGDVVRMKTGKSGEGEGEGGQEIEDEERDFFQRELDQLGWGLAGLRSDDDVGFGEEAPGVNGGGGGGGVNGGAGEGEYADARTLEQWQNMR